MYGPSRDKHLLRKLMWIRKAWLSDRLELLIINSELVRGFLSAIFYHWFGNFQMWILGFGITFCSKLIFKYRISYAVKKSYNMVHIIWDSAFYRPRKNSIFSRKNAKYGPYYKVNFYKVLQLKISERKLSSIIDDVPVMCHFDVIELVRGYVWTHFYFCKILPEGETLPRWKWHRYFNNSS